MNSRSKISSQTACVFVALLAACGGRAPAGEGGASALRRELLRAGRVEVVACEPGLVASARRLLTCAQERSTLVWSAGTVGAESDAAGRILLGSASSPAAIELLERVSVRVRAGAGGTSFTYAGLDFAGATDVVRATFEDPLRPGLPLTVAFGNTPGAIEACCRDLVPATRPWIEVLRAGDLVLAGPIGVDGSPWPTELARPGLERQTIAREQRSLPESISSVVVRFGADVAEADAWAALDAVHRARMRTMQWMEPGEQFPAFELTVLGVEAAFASWGGSDLAWTVNPIEPRGALFLPRASGLAADGGAPAALSEATLLLGRSSRAWMEDAAAVYGARTWFGIELDRWLPRLARAADRPGIAAIVDARANERISPHVLVPLRAALWQFWIDTRGAAHVRELWRGSRAVEFSPALDEEFWHSIEARTGMQRVELERSQGVSKQRVEGSELTGFVVPAVRAPWERAVSRDEEWFASLQAFGADTLAFAVDGIEATDPFGQDSITTSQRYGFTSCEVVFVARARAAAARGFLVAVIPRLFSTRSGGYSGHGSRRTEAEWKLCYERLARFVEHAALALELGHGNLLALGSGMRSIVVVDDGRQSAANKVAEWKRQGLEHVLRTARSTTTAALVWIADSPLEAREIEFQDQLDLVAGSVPAPSALVLRGSQAAAKLGAHVGGFVSGYADVGAARHKRVLLVPIQVAAALGAGPSATSSERAAKRWGAVQLRLMRDALSRGVQPAARTGRLVAGEALMLEDRSLNAPPSSPDSIFDALRGLLAGR